jgi:putative transposase
MGKDNRVASETPEVVEDSLTELLRQGAQQLIRQAVEAELAELLAQYAHQTDAQGRAAVVRNGYLPQREILTGLGPVSVQVPKVRSRTQEPVTFRSSLVPPYVRRAKTVEAALPWLYLKGISTGQMQEALEVLVGPEAKGLSAPVVSRLKKQWQAEYDQWRRRRLEGARWVYWWVDGVYSGLRAEPQRLCLLVVIGLNELGEKHFLAIEDGVRESTQSWREVLLDLKQRGLEEAPRVAVGDGALGFWAALEEVFHRRGNNAAGCTRRPMCSTTCPGRCTPRPRQCCTTSGWRRLGSRPRRRWTISSRSTKPSTPRQPSAGSKTGTPCWSSMTFRRNTGCTCGPPTR